MWGEKSKNLYFEIVELSFCFLHRVDTILHCLLCQVLSFLSFGLQAYFHRLRGTNSYGFFFPKNTVFLTNEKTHLFR